MKKRFDWRQRMAALTPGQGCAAQQARAALLPTLTADLTAWAAHYGLPGERIRASAYAGATCMPEVLLAEHAMLLARYALWIFVLDALLDHGPASGGPLAIQHGLLAEQAIAELLGWLQSASLAPASASLLARLGRAFHDLQDQTIQGWDLAAEQDLRGCATILQREATAMLEGMRTELQLQTAYHARGQLPDMQTYLAAARHSISLSAVGSLIVGFEASPQETWAAWKPAMDAAATAIRLSNDLAGRERELREGKVTALTIMLGQLGADPWLADPHSHMLQQASQALLSMIEQLLERFALLLDDLPASRLGEYLQNSLAVTLSHTALLCA